MKRLIIGFSVFTCAAATAFAQSSAVNENIAYAADTVSADINTRTVDLTGNVVITQGDMRMRANSVRMEGVRDNTVERVVANGNVVVDSPSGTGSGDTGIYDVAAKLITFTGKVVLSKEKNVMRGNMLTINLVTGQSKLAAGGNRVQGLFTPPPQTGARP